MLCVVHFVDDNICSAPGLLVHRAGSLGISERSASATGIIVIFDGQNIETLPLKALYFFLATYVVSPLSLQILVHNPLFLRRLWPCPLDLITI